jgi:hypothetical protein
MKNQPRHINRFVYFLSLLTWLMNVCLVFIPFFFDVSGLWLLVIFASVFIQAIASGAFYDETLLPEIHERKMIDYCLLASKYIAHSLTAISFVSLLIGGGSPDMIDGAYCLVNHGQIIRYISGNWYIYFVICHAFAFTCGMLTFSTMMALRIRGLYLMQQP